MISQKKLEKLNKQDLELEEESNLSKINKLKKIIKNYDEKLNQLKKLRNEAEQYGDKFKSIHEEDLKVDYDEETKFFGKNKGKLDYYFTSQSKEDLYFSTYEKAVAKVSEILKLETDFIFFGPRFLNNHKTVWGAQLSCVFMYSDYVSEPIGNTNQLYLSGDVIVERGQKLKKYFNRMSEIDRRCKLELFDRIPIPEKKLYEEYLGIYERRVRKIELIKRSRIRDKSNAENVGYVYVLSNEAYPNTYKIGSTYGLPEDRAEELTGTGHLTPFKVVGKIKVQSAEYYEKSIHKLLNKFRVKKGREFFKLDLPKIKECLKQVSNISEKGSKKITLAKMQKEIKF